MRLFFALWPDDTARDALARLAEVVAHEAGGRPTAAEKLHLTVAFLGAVETDRAASLAHVGAAVAARVDAFEVSLERIGGTASGVAWITPGTAVASALLALHAGIRDGLRERGFRVEARAFRPHVTLARGCTRVPRRQTIAPLRWHATAVSLVASQAQRGGSLYSDVAAWPLGGR